MYACIHHILSVCIVLLNVMAPPLCMPCMHVSCMHVHARVMYIYADISITYLETTVNKCST